MSSKITNQILEEQANLCQLYTQCNVDTNTDINARRTLRIVLQRVHDVLGYAWCCPVRSDWVDVLMSDELVYPEHVFDYDSYCEYWSQGYWRSFGSLYCFSDYDDYVRFNRKFYMAETS